MEQVKSDMDSLKKDLDPILTDEQKSRLEKRLRPRKSRRRQRN